MVLHADGAKGAMDQDPERAKLALNTIMRPENRPTMNYDSFSVCCVWNPPKAPARKRRGRDGRDSHRSVPRLAEVDRVVAAVRAFWHPCGHRTGRPTPPSSDQSVDLAAYRVLQEALTTSPGTPVPGLLPM